MVANGNIDNCRVNEEWNDFVALEMRYYRIAKPHVKIVKESFYFLAFRQRSLYVLLSFIPVK